MLVKPDLSFAAQAQARPGRENTVSHRIHTHSIMVFADVLLLIAPLKPHLHPCLPPVRSIWPHRPARLYVIFHYNPVFWGGGMWPLHALLLFLTNSLLFSLHTLLLFPISQFNFQTKSCTFSLFCHITSSGTGQELYSTNLLKKSFSFFLSLWFWWFIAPTSLPVSTE